MVGSCAEQHGIVEEHLDAYVEDGWQIAAVSGFGSMDGINSRDWIAVVLERES